MRTQVAAACIAVFCLAFARVAREHALHNFRLTAGSLPQGSPLFATCKHAFRLRRVVRSAIVFASRTIVIFTRIISTATGTTFCHGPHFVRARAHFFASHVTTRMRSLPCLFCRLALAARRSNQMQMPAEGATTTTAMAAAATTATIAAAAAMGSGWSSKRASEIGDRRRGRRDARTYFFFVVQLDGCPLTILRVRAAHYARPQSNVVSFGLFNLPPAASDRARVRLFC